MRRPLTSHSMLLSGIIALHWCFLACCSLQAQSPVVFEDAVAPILRKNCIACHNAKLAEGGLNLETTASILKGGDSGASIDKANIDASSLISRPAGTVEPIMPPDGNTVGAVRLSPEQLAILKAWVAGGMQSNGSSANMINQDALKLPENARASYAVAISPDNEFVAFGRAGQLLIHNARRTTQPAPIEGTLDPLPTQVIPNAHNDFIYSIAISPDGKTIATGSTGQVKIWRQAADPIEASHKGIEALGVPLAQIICTSTDGNWVAVNEPVPAADPAAPATSNIRMIARNGAPTRTFAVAEPSLTAATWSVSGNRFFAVSATNMLYAWDLTVDPIAERNKTQLPSAIQSLIALDETTLLTVGDRKLGVWQYKTETAAEAIPEHPLVAAVNGAGPIDMLSVSPDRTQLVTATREEAGTTALKLWSIPQAKLVGPITRDRNERLILASAERDSRRAQSMLDRSNAVVGELDNALKAEDTAVTNAMSVKEKADQALTAKTQEVQNAIQAIADHEKLIAEAKAAVEAATAKVTQLTTELEPKKKTMADLEKQKMTMQTMVDNAMKTIASTQESQKAAQARLEQRKQRVAQQTERLAATQAATAQRKAIADAVKFTEQTIAFAGNNLLATVSAPNASNVTGIELFALDSLERLESRPVALPVASQAVLSAVVNNAQKIWQPVSVIDAPNAIVDRATALAFSPDGTRLAIGSGMPSRNGLLSIFNVAPDQLASGQPAAMVLSLPDLHSDTLLGLAYSPDGTLLASCGADKMTKLIDTQTNAVVKIFEGHTHHVLSLAWQEDGSKLSTASADATVKVWDIEKGESTKTIAGFGTEVTSIAYVGSTPNIVTSTLNNLVRMHDTNSGNQAKQFGPVGDSLYSVTVAPNGKFAIACGQEGIVRIWFVDDGKLIAEWK